MRFIVFLILGAIGVSMVVYTDVYERTTGKIGWAERNLGGAGTNTFYKLLGLLIIAIGMMYLTGLFEKALGGSVNFFIGGLKS